MEIVRYEIHACEEYDSDLRTPNTLMIIDKYGNGAIELPAPDEAKARIFAKQHLEIHKNWKS
jgi:hypothetical protein